MIQIKIVRKNESITGFVIEGHAQYAPRGQDIVCAAVSALSISTINSIHSLTATPHHFRNEDNLLELEILEASAESDLLTESLFLSLKSIEEEYLEHVTISEMIL